MVNIKKAIAILRAAHARIESKKNSMVCLAIDECRGDLEAKIYLKRWIDQQLDGHTTYFTWYLENNPAEARQKIDMRAKRLEWIDWMVGELETEAQNAKT